MALAVRALALLLLHLAVVATSPRSTSLDSRIWEILSGPPLGPPKPATRTAFFLCRENQDVKLNLLRSTGISNARIRSAQRQPGEWFKWLQNTAKSYPDHMAAFVLDLSCPGAMQVLKTANTTKLFRSPYRWLLMSSASDETSVSLDQCVSSAESVLGDLEIFVDSEVLFMCGFGQKARPGLLIEWYRLYMHTAPFYGELASWSSGDGRIQWTARSLLPMAIRRSDLRNQTLKIGFLLRFNESLKHLDDGYETRKDTMTKYFWPILHNTVKMLNATMVAKWSETWGFPVNGTWTGMAGMQIRGDVDISGIPAVHDNLRATVLTFVSFRGPSAGLFIYRAPPMSYEANLFALPFPDSLWAAAGGLISICVFLLYLLLRTEDAMDQKEPSPPSSASTIAVSSGPVQSAGAKSTLAQNFVSTGEDVQNNVELDVAKSSLVAGDGIQAKARLHGSWSDVILLVFGAICQQGSPVEARTVPGRIVTISLLIGIMFLFTSYSASIVVLLQSTSNSIRTLEDLWKSRLPCGAEDVRYMRYYFSLQDDEVRLGIYKKVLKKNANSASRNNFLPLERGVERVRKDYFAFHALTTSMYPIISDTWQEHEKCSLREIRKMIDPQNPDISTRRNSPILEIFKITLRKMHERGIRSREIARLIPGKPVCTNPGSNFGSVSVMDCYFAMVILTTGLLASLLVLGLEHLAFRKLAKTAAELEAAAAEAAAVLVATFRRRLLAGKAPRLPSNR